MKHPKNCLLIGTYYYPFGGKPKCDECPLAKNCPELKEANKEKSNE
jgi:uncharacterized protein (UPF0179 family)